MGKYFEEMSESFQRAFGYSNNKYYRLSIPLYEQAVVEDPNCFSALNNLAVAKIFVGIEERNVGSIEQAIQHLKDAISITKDVFEYEDGYPIAEGNLAWAYEWLAKLKEM